MHRKIYTTAGTVQDFFLQNREHIKNMLSDFDAATKVSRYLLT